ncbi:MAG: hypothetical protein FJ125_18685, partial [Deltaproteobacteria bacterium]|nr:hypothetical protein [Deltaproteobacteria bacterium]
MGLALLAGCAPADDSGGDRLGPLVEGTLLFEERVPTDDGLSAELFVRPARRVRIDALDAAGGLMVTSYSDESGGFAAPAAAAMVQAVSATREPSRIAVVDSAGALHRQVFPFGEAGATYTVPAADEQQTAGAFHILDVAERVADLVTEATGRPPHALRLTWQLGNTGTLALGLPVNASYYRRDPADPVIVLQGGEAGRVATTMTSHFDDAVIAHELGHFIMDTYSYDASLGGGHNANNLYFTLALSEGFATWLGSVALDDSVYISTTGQPPTPQLNFANYDIENVDNIPRRAFGNDSELTVSEVLWDLY